MKKLVPIQKKIIESRCKSLPRIEDLSKDNLEYFGDKLLFKLSALFGFSIPHMDVQARSISRELIDFIFDFGYSHYNEDEVELALKLNLKTGLYIPEPVEIETATSNRSLPNVDFFSKVLFNYAALRNSLDKRIQNVIDGHEER